MNKIDLLAITTENPNINTKAIDLASSLEIATLINNEDQTIPFAIEKVLPQIAKAIDLGYETIRNSGRIFYLGAGTSGRLGVLDASEMPPTFNVSNNLIIGIIAGGDSALRNSIEGAEDDKKGAINDLNKFDLNKNDLVVGIAASGRTPYAISAIEYGNSLGCKTISLTTSKDSVIGKLATVNIEVLVGAEPIAGSTRMKSGSAQKMVLNTFSTGIMIKLGKVYQNLMIDVKASNLKLVERAIIITQTISDKSREEVVAALEKCNYAPKTAVVMLLLMVKSEKAQELLLKYNDNLGMVLKNE